MQVVGCLWNSHTGRDTQTATVSARILRGHVRREFNGLLLWAEFKEAKRGGKHPNTSPHTEGSAFQGLGAVPDTVEAPGKQWAVASARMGRDHWGTPSLSAPPPISLLVPPCGCRCSALASQLPTAFPQHCHCTLHTLLLGNPRFAVTATPWAFAGRGWELFLLSSSPCGGSCPRKAC